MAYTSISTSIDDYQQKLIQEQDRLYQHQSNQLRKMNKILSKIKTKESKHWENMMKLKHARLVKLLNPDDAWSVSPESGQAMTTTHQWSAHSRIDMMNPYNEASVWAYTWRTFDEKI